MFWDLCPVAPSWTLLPSGLCSLLDSFIHSFMPRTHITWACEQTAVTLGGHGRSLRCPGNSKGDSPTKAWTKWTLSWDQKNGGGLARKRGGEEKGTALLAEGTAYASLKGKENKSNRDIQRNRQQQGRKGVEGWSQESGAEGSI